MYLVKHVYLIQYNFVISEIFLAELLFILFGVGEILFFAGKLCGLF